MPRYSAKDMDDYQEMHDDLRKAERSGNSEKACELRRAIEKFEDDKRNEGTLETIDKVIDESNAEAGY